MFNDYDQTRLETALTSIPNICEKFGLVAGAAKIGAGLYGTVYESTNPKIVVKVSSDADEARKVKQLVGKSILGVVRYFAIHRINYKYNLIVMERLHVPPAWFFQVVAKRGAPTQSTRYSYYKTYNEKHPMNQRERKVYRYVERAHERLQKMGIYHADIHKYNIMCTKNGEYKLIDIG
jgi:RIO-like serine/threonine protein kinase